MSSRLKRKILLGRVLLRLREVRPLSRAMLNRIPTLHLQCQAQHQFEGQNLASRTRQIKAPSNTDNRRRPHFSNTPLDLAPIQPRNLHHLSRQHQPAQSYQQTGTVNRAQTTAIHQHHNPLKNQHPLLVQAP